MEDKKANGLTAKSSKSVFIILAVVIAFIITAFFVYVVRESQLSRIEEAVNVEINHKNQLVEKNLDLVRTKVQLYALKQSQLMNDADISKNELQPFLSDSTPLFDYLGFIHENGVYEDKYGEMDLADYDFFRKGMSGESGSAVIINSKRTHQSLVVFYTPISYEDSVVGVMAGSIGGRTKLRPLLDSIIVGKIPAIEILCDSKFKVIVSSKSEVDYGLPIRSLIPGKFANQSMELFLKNAMQVSSGAFRFSAGNGDAIAAISQISSTGWYLIHIVPNEAVASEVNLAVFLTIFVAIVLVGIMAFFVYIIQRANRLVRNESEGRFLNTLEALAESYGSVFEINSDTGSSTTIRLAPVLEQKAGSLFKGNSKYNQIMAVYSNKMVVAEDVILFNQVKTLDDVKESFARKSQFDFVFRTHAAEGYHFVQAMFIKPSKLRPEFVMGFKNVDDMMEAELEKRRKLSEQRKALEAALDKARSADKAKSKFLFNMSHDIRTPMNAVLGYDTLAMRYVWELGLPPDQTEKVVRCLNNIQMSGKQLLGLINSVLNMARIESGNIVLDESPTIMAELTGEVSVIFEESAREKNVMLLISRNLKHRYFFCDKIKLQQVILNVVNNAIQYTESGGKIRVNFKEENHEQDGWCYIVTTVEDNGIGISEDFLPHIFEDFEREKSATASGVVGSGLGLSIVKKVVDLMGGTVQIQSQVGVGTTVTLRIPHRISNESDIVEGSVIPTRHSESLQGKRVLLVEDNKMNREIAEEMLKNIGVYVECAEDGIECLKKIEQEPAGSFDMVLMDIQMPRMNGFEAAKAIRQLSDPLKANILIYAMTANSFSEDKIESENAGMNGHISKPVDFAKFFSLLKKAFG